MRRLVLGFAAVGVVGLVLVVALREGAPPRSRAERQPEVAEEPAAGTPAPQVASDAPPWRLVGRVTEEDGTPVAGASVDTARSGTPWDDPPDAVRTDDSGRYEIDIGFLRSDDRVAAYVQATAPGYRPGWGPYSVEARLASQPVQHSLHIVVSKGAGVTGRVVDASGRPVGGAYASLRTAADDFASSICPTDRAGRFLLGALAAGDYCAFVIAPGYREGRSDLFRVSPDVAKDVGDIVLLEGLVVDGHVRYADGAPVGGATLQLSARSGWSMGEFVRTSSDGAFRFWGLEEGACRIRFPGWVGAADAPETTCDAGARGVLLTVPGGRIRVRLVDEKGDPMPGARRQLFLGAVAPANLWLGGTEAHGPEVSYFAPCGTRGVVIAEAEGRIPAEQAFEVASDRNESEVVLRLVPLAPTARLRVELDAPDATPFFGRFLTPLARRHVMTVNHDGVGDPILKVPPGSWLLEIQPGDAPPQFFEPVETAVEISADRENVVRLATPHGGRVRLEVKAHPSFMSGFKGALVRAEDGTEIPLKEFLVGIAWSGTLDANRAALVRPLLRPGLYTARIDLPKHQRFETTVRVDAGAIADVVAEMVKLKE